VVAADTINTDVPALPREDKAKKKASSVRGLRYGLDDRGSIPGRAAVLSWPQRTERH
jgi:hypothetical protein